MNVATLVLMLHAIAPFLGQASLQNYSDIISREARRQHVDSLLVAAIISHESHWRPFADNGKCIGLGQVCLETQQACRGVGGLNAAACRARRQELFDGPTNIHVLVGQLAVARSYCGPRASLRDIVSSYAGTGACGEHGGRTHPIVGEILKIRRNMRKLKMSTNKKRKQK